jgi:nucleoid DNA-binding protein
MTKADIVDVIAKGTGLTKLETSAVIDGFFATVGYALQNGDKVELRGFGTFCLRERREKHVANPKTGKMMVIPNRIVPDFKPSPHLKASVSREMKASGRFISKTIEEVKKQTDIFKELDRFFTDE